MATKKKAVKPADKKSSAKKAVRKKPKIKKIVKKPGGFAKKAPIKKAAAPAKPLSAKKPSGFAEQLLYATLKVLDDRQAEDIVTINLGTRNSVADYLVIASGRASRQIAAMADYLQEAYQKLGVRQTRIEGLSEANWVLVDCGDIIVHLFRPEVRNYYNLENMWAERAKA